ncbi:MAG: hypothetical protein Q9166_005277 [cf. Caloplaca sp. 2 TL-2023]
MGSPETSMEKIMAWKNSGEDRGFSAKFRQSRSPGFSSQHIRSRPDLPTRASQIAFAANPAQAEDPVFTISSPGDVSPLSSIPSPTTSGAKDFPERHQRAADTDTRVEKASSVVFADRQLPPQQPKPGRPSLKVTIPISTAKPAVEMTCPSADSDSESGQASDTSMPVDTPAQAGTRAAKHPKKVNLGDELALCSLSSLKDERLPTTANLSEATERDLSMLRSRG